MPAPIRPLQPGSLNRRYKYRPLTEINVTPFVDVMLVLLVIFMIAAPLMTVGVEVDLPEAQTNPISENKEPLVITVKKDGTLFIQDTEIKTDKLISRLNAITDNSYDVRLFVRGDKAINYGKVMEVMGVLNSAGFQKIALIAELPQS